MYNMRLGLRDYEAIHDEGQQGSFLLRGPQGLLSRLSDAAADLPRWIWKAVAGGLVLLLVVVATVAAAHHPRGQTHGPPDCLHFLGGGKVAANGDVASAQSAALEPGCERRLRRYFEGGQYADEVQLVASQALTYFKAQQAQPAKPPADWTQLVVFDIDETCLSNADTFFKPGPYAHNRTNAPAIKPVLELYKYLYSVNISAAFITGRREADRNATAANLLSVGYGPLCDAALPKPDKPCYAALHMRAANDTRLASVYKPEKRKQLKAAGFKLVGCLGDQFSDLAGEAWAEAVWKLPNPMYFIL